MKIPNRQELQQIAFNHTSDINFNFKNFRNLYKNVLQNPPFKVCDTTLASDNSPRFRRTLL